VIAGVVAVTCVEVVGCGFVALEMASVAVVRTSAPVIVAEETGSVSAATCCDDEQILAAASDVLAAETFVTAGAVMTATCSACINDIHIYTQPSQTETFQFSDTMSSVGHYRYQKQKIIA